MYCENTTFIYHEKFSKYMKVGAISKDIFDYPFDMGAENFLLDKKKNIYMNYLKNGIQSILKLIKTLMMDLKMMLHMKACRISRMTSLLCINYSEMLLHQYVLACQVSSQ